MVGARSAAMGLNRLIDKAIDHKKNPRTAGRALPAGLLSSKETLIFIIVSFIALFIASYHLNPLCMKLMPIAVFLPCGLLFHETVHLVMPFVLGVDDRPRSLGRLDCRNGQVHFGFDHILCGGSFLDSGFDIIYATQDEEHDRNEGLYSIPSRFGIGTALFLARGFHFVTAAGLISLFFF